MIIGFVLASGAVGGLGLGCFRCLLISPCMPFSCTIRMPDSARILGFPDPFVVYYAESDFDSYAGGPRWHADEKARDTEAEPTTPSSGSTMDKAGTNSAGFTGFVSTDLVMKLMWLCGRLPPAYYGSKNVDLGFRSVGLSRKVKDGPVEPGCLGSVALG
ncbi:hypothetical protein Nepgr_033882 [Nepenthes gracilis]|uniref:Uncharacterized protein n=1 Tax=Nepenthes gracilis TaxID=150966 RepID=A0AAD3Y798_NEPGR|nr:hypothetical protein Nepgr_033882 [Nepenthes gracilis]